MIYKVYKIKFKTLDVSPDERFQKFNEIYKKNDVHVVLGGTNKNDPKEVYYITAYKDDNHYEETIKKLKNNSKYAELTKQLEDSRESIEVISLKDVL